VEGWDDPRMPTLAGMRRRGYPPAALRSFVRRVGVAKRDSVNEMALLEHSLRENLNQRAQRAMGVLRPLRVVIENYPEDREEQLDAINNPGDPSAGTRSIPFSRVLYVEREDFEEVPPPKFFRLTPGREVRLRYAYYVTCVGVVRDDAGAVVELRCTYDPQTRGGSSPDGRKVKATLHWVSTAHAVDAEVRLYDRLFDVENPGADYLEHVNPESLVRLEGCRLEPGLADAAPGARFQLERLGYFCVDPDTKPGAIVLNRTVALRDTWAKVQQGGG
jgi:glutaminyl-tRNA synthetase